MNDQHKSISLALIGLLAASIVSIFQASGSYDLYDPVTGFMLFFIAEAYRDEAPEKGPGSVAFAMTEGAALLLIISPLSIFFEKSVTNIFFPLAWVGLSCLAYLRRRIGWTWPF